MPLASPEPLLAALASGEAPLRSRPADLEAVLASGVHLALTADCLATREHIVRRLGRDSVVVRHLAPDVRIGDREALVGALKGPLGAASILPGERRLVVISMADDLAPCGTMIRCIKNLVDAYEGGARFVLSCPTPALAHVFRSHCLHLHCRVLGGGPPVDPVNRWGGACEGDEREAFRDALRSLLVVQDDREFWARARAFALQATTSCMPVREVGAMLVDVAPYPEVAEACAECDRAWRRSGDALTAIQGALVLTKNSISHRSRPGEQA